MKFRDKISLNTIRIILSVPFSAFFSLYETSFLNIVNILFFVFIIVDEFFHINRGCIASDRSRETHDILNIAVLGSKVENKFVIILMGFVFFLFLVFLSGK